MAPSLRGVPCPNTEQSKGTTCSFAVRRSSSPWGRVGVDAYAGSRSSTRRSMIRQQGSVLVQRLVLERWLDARRAVRSATMQSQHVAVAGRTFL